MSTARVAWYPVPERKRRAWPMFLPLLLPLVVLAGFAAYVLLTPAKPHVLVPAPGHRGALIWGDGIFASSPEMRAWLLQHGGRYPSWAKKHPHGVSLIVPMRKPHRHVTRTQHTKKHASR